MDKESTPEVAEEIKEELVKDRLSRRVDRSLLVALVAVVISLVGTVVSIYEARVLREQQDLMAQQKSAAAWPYIIGVPNMAFYGDTSILLTYEFANSGIGPAILGDVEYLYDGQNYESYSIDDGISASEIGQQFLVSTNQNTQIDSMVIQAGETINVFTLRLDRKSDTVRLNSANQIAGKLSVQCCYCSVYGDCWYRGEGIAPRRRSECTSYLTY